MPVEVRTVIQLWPEIVLVLMACWILIGGALHVGRMNSRSWSVVALGAYAVAALALVVQHQTHWGEYGDQALFPPSGPITVDLLGYSVCWMALLVGVLFTLILGWGERSPLATEQLGLLMLLVVGVMLVGVANDLVLLFVGLEMVSIPTYVLLFLGRKDRATSEATAKYFFLSILSSALLLYGLSFLYGLGGVTLIAGGAFPGGSAVGLREAIATLAAGEDGGRGLLSLAPAALVLILAGLGFRITAVPFHFYAPDVYQGVTSANAGLLATAPKIVGVAALIKVTFVAVSGLGTDFLWQVVMVVSILTMTIGNVSALWQRNIRRLLAYSSIAHGGYLLIGLAVAAAAAQEGQDFSGGLAAMLFYLFVYVLGSAGCFAALAWLGSERGEVDRLEQLQGLARSRPLAAAVLGVSLFSLSGIPPLAGFWGKFTLFNSAIVLAAGETSPTVQTCFTILAVAGVLNAAIAAAYYLKVIGAMYFSPPVQEAEARGGSGAWAAMALCGLLLVGVGVAPGGLVRYAELAERAAAADMALPAIGALPADDRPGPGEDRAVSAGGRAARGESSGIELSATEE